MFVRMARFTSRAYSDSAWRTTSGHYDPTAWLALGLQDFSEPMTGVSRGSLLLQGTGARRVSPEVCWRRSSTLDPDGELPLSLTGQRSLRPAVHSPPPTISKAKYNSHPHVTQQQNQDIDLPNMEVLEL